LEGGRSFGSSRFPEAGAALCLVKHTAALPHAPPQTPQRLCPLCPPKTTPLPPPEPCAACCCRLRSRGCRARAPTW
jgi:hypothetical protein